MVVEKNVKMVVKILMMAVVFASCQKANQECYTCKITGSLAGPQYDRTETICVGSEAELFTRKYTDPLGNEMNFECKKK